MPSVANLDRVAMVVLRYLRKPVFTLILVYAVGITGMALIPGVDANGQPEYMSLFHAFYFFTYTATTTGFGEIPSAFSDEQRLWAIVCLYMGVIAWLYAIGSMIRLVQNPNFVFALSEYRFARQVRRIAEPFYIICGFGDTGSLLARGLSEHDMRAVIIDNNEERIKALGLRDYKDRMLGLCADASIPKHLLDAGICHPCCKAVVVLHNDKDINLKIAVMTRYLNAKLPVISRASSSRAQRQLESLQRVTVINSFEIFAQLLSTAIVNPKLHNFNSWLVRAHDVVLGKPLQVPKGDWILCGYGRMGHWLLDHMLKHGLRVTIIDPDVDPDSVSVEVIRGFADHTVLKKAGIHRVAGVVAGTNNDTHNLSILMCARALNPDVFTIIRQNDHANQIVFDAADAHLTLQSSLTTARRILKHLISPLVQTVIDRFDQQESGVLEEVTQRLGKLVDRQVPHLWKVDIGDEQTPAADAILNEAKPLILKDILRDPGDRNRTLECVVLAIRRSDEIHIAPDEFETLLRGDQLLLCGTRRSQILLEATLSGPYTLRYLATGKEPPRAYVFQWLAK